MCSHNYVDKNISELKLELCGKLPHTSKSPKILRNLKKSREMVCPMSDLTDQSVEK